MKIIILLAFIPSRLCVLLDIPLGELEGSEKVTNIGTPYYAFEGIPYAQPPIGKLRFVAPVDITPWEGVYDATHKRSVCPQVLEEYGNAFKGVEDCLHVNVYTPTLDTNQTLPVMVYLFGGGYKKESAEQCSDPQLFMDSGVVLLSFNYRLGMLGFLTLDTPEVPGNAGIRDAICLLRWVKEYIREFSGDPDNVTLLGTSSGAVIIDILRDAQTARGLFHKAIAISGVSPDPTSRPNSTRVNSRLVLDYLNIKSVTNALDTLQTTLLDKILNITMIITLSGEPYDYSPFSPTYEINNDYDQAVYLDVRDEKNNCTIVNDIPIIIGHTSQDFFNTESSILEKFMITNDDYIIPYDWEVSSNTSAEVASIIRKYYFKENSVDIDSYGDFEALFSLLSHARVIFPQSENIISLSNCTRSPLYHYIFDYLGVEVSRRWIAYTAVMHGEELNYLFPSELYRVEDRSSDGWVRRRLVAMFTNFARTGNPTPEISNLLPVTWLPFEPVTQNYLHFGVDLFSSVNPAQRVFKFWNDLKEKYAAKTKTRSKIVPVSQL